MIVKGPAGSAEDGRFPPPPLSVLSSFEKAGSEEGLVRGIPAGDPLGFVQLALEIPEVRFDRRADVDSLDSGRREGSFRWFPTQLRRCEARRFSPSLQPRLQEGELWE
jgi:hypothetical protein